MNKLQLMTGVDIPIPAIQATIHQPTIKEISYLGEQIYFSIIQLFCFNKATIMASTDEKGASVLSNLNNFQIFMTLIGDQNNEGRSKLITDMISTFTLLFPQYKCQFLPTGLFFNDPTTKTSFIINDTNFDALKEVLMFIGGINNDTGGQNSNFNPRNKQAAEIAAKLMKSRAKIAKEKGYSADGTLSRYVSILTVGLSSMSLTDCLNLTVYQLYDLIQRYGLYIGWDLDIKSRLAGGKPDNKPDDWMKDLHS